ncbi:MAG: hypothetical protein IPN86_19135 [Saprospiraceae bacterium]|nr:hypothetical protein [Saprospiraceae bacterium]
MDKLAVIDLGSNTFHLLIVQMKIGGGFDIVFRKRVFTGLSDGGISVIKEHKINQGLETIREFRDILDMFHNPRLSVIGTAALRNASNRSVFIDQAETILQSKINIIDGIQEADYIYKGMTLHQDLQSGAHLIMDVGGGSTEFILVNEGEKIWSNSYPLGVGMLHEEFHKTEPITNSAIHNLTVYVQQMTAEIAKIIGPYKPFTLAGASGSFEILLMMTGIKISQNNINTVTNEKFLAIYDKIITSDEAQRNTIEGLPSERVKLIVVGMVLKKAIFDLLQPEKILVSPYSLKEGVLREMIEETP